MGPRFSPRQALRCASLPWPLAPCGLQLAEERAQSYYEHGMQLLAAHDNKRAEIEFRNAVKYNKKLLPAWQSLAQVEELDAQLERFGSGFA